MRVHPEYCKHGRCIDGGSFIDEPEGCEECCPPLPPEVQRVVDSPEVQAALQRADEFFDGLESGRIELLHEPPVSESGWAVVTVPGWLDAVPEPEPAKEETVSE